MTLRPAIARTAGIAGLLLMLSCNSAVLFKDPPSKRVFTVKVVADPSFANHTAWKDNVTNLITNASRVYKSWFEVTFVIDTMVVWDISKEPCYHEMFEYDCLMKSVPKDGADIVLCFFKEDDRYKFHIAGYSFYEYGYIRVTQGAWWYNKGGYEIAFVTLVHELGHFFGGIHVRHDPRSETRYVLSPQLSEDLVAKKGMEYEVQLPDFHPGNVQIIKTLVDRPTGRSDCDSCFRRIQKAYAEARREHGQFQMGQGPDIAAFQADGLAIPDIYHYLSNWASIYKKDSLAIAYLDTMVQALRAVTRACRECRGACPPGLCTSIGGWYAEYEKSWYHYDRAVILLGAGRYGQAERAFQEFLSSDIKQSPEIRQKIRAEFEYLKEISTPPSGEPINESHDP